MIRRFAALAILLVLAAVVMVARPRQDAPSRVIANARKAAEATRVPEPERRAPAPSMTPREAIRTLELPTFAKADEIRREEGDLAYHGITTADHAVTFSPD